MNAFLFFLEEKSFLYSTPNYQVLILSRSDGLDKDEWGEQQAKKEDLGTEKNPFLSQAPNISRSHLSIHPTTYSYPIYSFLN